MCPAQGAQLHFSSAEVWCDHRVGLIRVVGEDLGKADAVDELRLEARRFVNLARWQWVLTGASGKPMAEHEVRLDPGVGAHLIT